MNFDEVFIRCSSIGYIMTDPRTKAEKERGELSETCKGHLSDIFVRMKYGRQTDKTNKYTIKGNLVEEDSLTLYSRYKKQFYVKNKEQLKNEFISGTPDIIFKDEIIDIKSSWDIFTFFRNTDDKLNSNYYWQMQGYMALTGCKRATLAYCLVNTPDALISDEKRRLFYKMGIVTEDNKDYMAACEEIDKLMVYDDIPNNEKVIEIAIERDEEAIQSIYNRVAACRQYMAKRYGSFITQAA